MVEQRNNKLYLNRLKLNRKPLNGYLLQLLVESSVFPWTIGRVKGVTATASKTMFSLKFRLIFQAKPNYRAMRNTSLTVFAYVLVLAKHYRAMNFKEKCSTKFHTIHILVIEHHRDKAR